MHLNYSYSGHSITEDELRAFEDTYHLRLPDDYRAFLLKHNGGIVTPYAFSFERDNVIDGSWVGWFYGLHHNGLEYTSLEDVYVSQRIAGQSLYSVTPTDYFIFASDMGKNDLCFSLKETDYGAVYYVDTDEIDTINGQDVARLYYIAPSFTAFLEMLHD
jgi:hypothetical protein